MIEPSFVNLKSETKQNWFGSSAIRSDGVSTLRISKRSLWVTLLQNWNRCQAIM